MTTSQQQLVGQSFDVVHELPPDDALELPLALLAELALVELLEDDVEVEVEVEDELLELLELDEELEVDVVPELVEVVPLELVPLPP